MFKEQVVQSLSFNLNKNLKLLMFVLMHTFLNKTQ